jgi:hypothetical protein
VQASGNRPGRQWFHPHDDTGRQPAPHLGHNLHPIMVHSRGPAGISA